MGHNSVVALIPGFIDLADDDWWEVQAQLLILSAALISKISTGDRQDPALEGEDGLDSPVSAAPGKDSMMLGEEEGVPPPGPMDEVTAQLEDVIGRLFVVSNSKNVLQVGLSALVELLEEFSNLQPMFMAVLLEQPHPLRQRLLKPIDDAEPPPKRLGKLTYVIGTSTREYEEKCVSALWPHLDMAKTFVKQHEMSPLDHWEVVHMEVFLACLPSFFKEVEGEEWLALFEKIKQYIFVALVAPDLHLLSTEIIRKFYLCNVEQVANQSIEGSTNILLQALRLLYDLKLDRARVEEQLMLDFLKDLYNRGGTIQFEITSVIETFQETRPAEYQRSKLYTLLTPA